MALFEKSQAISCPPPRSLDHVLLCLHPPSLGVSSLALQISVSQSVVSSFRVQRNPSKLEGIRAFLGQARVSPWIGCALPPVTCVQAQAYLVVSLSHNQELILPTRCKTTRTPFESQALPLLSIFFENGETQILSTRFGNFIMVAAMPFFLR